MKLLSRNDQLHTRRRIEHQYLKQISIENQFNSVTLSIPLLKLWLDPINSQQVRQDLVKLFPALKDKDRLIQVWINYMLSLEKFKKELLQKNCRRLIDYLWFPLTSKTPQNFPVQRIQVEFSVKSFNVIQTQGKHTLIVNTGSDYHAELYLLSKQTSSEFDKMLAARFIGLTKAG